MANLRLVLLIVVLFMGLAACGKRVAEEVAEATDTARPARATRTVAPSEAPVPSETPEPTATSTPEPAATETAVPTETATRTARPTSTPTRPPDAVVAAETLNVRSGPGTEYDVVGTLNRGDEMVVTGVNADRTWIRVTVGRRVGLWVSVANCEINVDLASEVVIDVAALTAVPQPTAPPPPTPTQTPVPQAQPPPTESPPAAAPAAVCDCSGDLYKCSDFSTHAQAQACYNYCVSLGVGDIHRLDQDGDGDACESLP